MKRGRPVCMFRATARAAGVNRYTNAAGIERFTTSGNRAPPKLKKRTPRRLPAVVIVAGSFEDFTGRKVGLVTVIRRAAASVHGAIMWFGVCECDKGRWYRSNNLRLHPPKTHKFCFRGIDVART